MSIKLKILTNREYMQLDKNTTLDASNMPTSCPKEFGLDKTQCGMCKLSKEFRHCIRTMYSSVCGRCIELPAMRNGKYIVKVEK